MLIFCQFIDIFLKFEVKQADKSHIMETAKSILHLAHHRNKKRIRYFGEVFTPEKYVNRMLEVTRESRTGKYIGGELENLLSKKHLFIAYALALSAHGVTDEEILYCLSHEGIKALDILIKRNFIIKKDDNRYKTTETDKGIILSFEVLKKHIKILAEEYKSDNIANNYIYYKMETLNKKGVKELCEIHRETHRKVQKLMEKEEYKGDMPVFSVGFFDMLFIEELENKKRTK